MFQLHITDLQPFINRSHVTHSLSYTIKLYYSMHKSEVVLMGL
jgi:hypothetical protein